MLQSATSKTRDKINLPVTSLILRPQKTIEISLPGDEIFSTVMLCKMSFPKGSLLSVTCPWRLGCTSTELIRKMVAKHVQETHQNSFDLPECSAFRNVILWEEKLNAILHCTVFIYLR